MRTPPKASNAADAGSGIVNARPRKAVFVPAVAMVLTTPLLFAL